MIKFKESDFTDLDRKARAQIAKEIGNCRKSIKTSEQKLKRFQDPVVDKESESNCYLIMEMCNEDRAFHHFKKRELQLKQTNQKKPKNYDGVLAKKIDDGDSESPRRKTFVERIQIMAEKNRMLTKEEIEKLRHDLE